MDDYEIECDFRAARWGAADSILEHLPAIAEGLPTLRDRFAMAALTGLVTHKTIEPEDVPLIGQDCYLIADAMLEARKGER